MRVILTDRSVLVSIAVAVAVLAVHGLLPARLRRSETVAVLGIAAGLRIAGRNLDRYREVPDRVPEWMVPVLVLAVIAAASAVTWTVRRAPLRPSLSVAVALAAAGVFLCVPETGVVRVVVGPMVLAGLAVGMGMARPLAPLAVLVTIGGLAWLSLVDGHTRGSAVVGAAACIGAVALVPLIDRGPPAPGPLPAADWRSVAPLGDRPVLIAHAILGLGVLACARWAGVQRSTTVAVVQVAVVLLATAGALWWLRAAAPGGRGASAPGV